MKNQTSSKGKKPWKKWHKIVLGCIGGFIAVILILVTLAPEGPNREITIEHVGRTTASVKHKIPAGWDDDSYMNKIRIHFIRNMKKITQDIKYKEVQLVTFHYTAAGSQGKDVLVATFWVEMKDWKKIDAKHFEGTFAGASLDHIEREELACLLQFNTMMNPRIRNALVKRVSG